MLFRSGEGSRSRSLSPVGQWQNNDHFSGPSLAEAATQFMMQQQDQTQSSPQPQPHQWRYLLDEIGMRSRPADEEEEDEEEEAKGSRAFSPPAKPQPGRSLPVVSTINAPSTSEAAEKEESESEDATTPGPSGAVGIQRKKPKGDVWW